VPQSLAKVYLHVIFSTKHREPVLADGWREERFQVLGGAVNQSGCQSMVVGGVADHVHLLIQLGRTITIADMVRVVKISSSLWVNQTRGLPAPFHWQNGYAALSVSQSNVDAVADYVRRQPAHHERRSFQDELRDWLSRYDVAWDEQYVWD
jgi:putative transposase